MMKLDTTMIALLSIVGIVAITFIVLYFTKKCSIAQCRKTPGAVCPKSLVCVSQKEFCDSSKNKTCIDKGSTQPCKQILQKVPATENEFANSNFYTTTEKIFSLLHKFPLVGLFVCVPDSRKIYNDNFIKINAIYNIQGGSDYMEYMDKCFEKKILYSIAKFIFDRGLKSMITHESEHEGKKGPDSLKKWIIISLLLLVLVDERHFKSESEGDFDNHIKFILDIIPLKQRHDGYSMFHYLQKDIKNNVRVLKRANINGIKILQNMRELWGKNISLPEKGAEIAKLADLVLPSKHITNLSSPNVIVDVKKIKHFKHVIDNAPIECKNIYKNPNEKELKTITDNLIENIVFDLVSKSGCASPSPSPP